MRLETLAPVTPLPAIRREAIACTATSALPEVAALRNRPPLFSTHGHVPSKSADKAQHAASKTITRFFRDVVNRSKASHEKMANTGRDWGNQGITSYATMLHRCRENLLELQALMPLSASEQALFSEIQGTELCALHTTPHNIRISQTSIGLLSRDALIGRKLAPGSSANAAFCASTKAETGLALAAIEEPRGATVAGDKVLGGTDYVYFSVVTGWAMEKRARIPNAFGEHQYLFPVASHPKLHSGAVLSLYDPAKWGSPSPADYVPDLTRDGRREIFRHHDATEESRNHACRDMIFIDRSATLNESLALGLIRTLRVLPTEDRDAMLAKRGPEQIHRMINGFLAPQLLVPHHFWTNGAMRNR